MKTVRVSPDLAADGEFDYRVPEHLAGTLAVGSQVRVPFGRTHRRAFVTAFPDAPACPPEKLRDIEAVLPAPPLFDGDILPEIKPAPLPGADAKELLQELGCSEEQIEELVEKKVVGKTLWAR